MELIRRYPQRDISAEISHCLVSTNTSQVTSSIGFLFEGFIVAAGLSGEVMNKSVIACRCQSVAKQSISQIIEA